MNVGRKIVTYAKAVGLSALVGMSSCAQKEAGHVALDPPVSKTVELLSMLERGDVHAVRLSDVPKGKRVLSVDEISQYVPDNNVGELFYQVYVGKADKAIRKANDKSGDLVTVGHGITGKNCIELAGGVKAHEGDYINAHSVDSIMNTEIGARDSIIHSCVSDSTYSNLSSNEKDAIVSYLYNVNPNLLKKAPKGKSFFQYLDEGNKGMVQAKFNVAPSSDVAAAGLAKRNIIQLLIFGDGQVYSNKEAQDNFRKQVDIVRKNKHGKELLEEAVDIVRKYGVNSDNLSKTENMIFAQK